MTTKPGHVNRRTFIRQGAAAAGFAAAASGARAEVCKSILPSAVLGANERIRTGHLGLGYMGISNLQFALQRPEIQPVAVCDLWQPYRERALAVVRDAGHPKPAELVYFEEMIADPDVDAVVVCTPDHWHAIPSIMACDAGKAVWCEKPVATTMREGKAMLEAARRNDTVFQCGTMQRSGAHFQEAVELIQSGYIGKVARAHVWVNEEIPVEGLGNPPDTDPPEGLDWERYLGWTPKVPFNQNRFHYHWRWFKEYCSGNMTDWGVHLVDIVLWAMGEDKPPRRVNAAGGKFVLTDNRNTPDQVDVTWEFNDYTLTLANCCYNPQSPYGRSRTGNAFMGTLGTLVIDRGGYVIIPNPANGGCEPKHRGSTPMNEPHWENFVRCVRDGKRPISDIAVCHNSTNVCHLGACSYFAGGPLDWDHQHQRIQSKDQEVADKANAFANREYQNGWSLDPPHSANWKT